MARRGAKTDVRLHSYTVRMVEKWNGLIDSKKYREKPTHSEEHYAT
jgi:hypothetical protein